MEKHPISAEEAALLFKKVNWYSNCIFRQDFDCEDGFYTLFSFSNRFGNFYQVIKKDGFVESILARENNEDPYLYEVVE